MASIQEYFDTWGEEIPSNQEELLDTIRWIRNAGLKNSDWTQLPDSPLSEDKKQEWAVYRQQLRDLLSDTSVDLTLIEIPAEPTA
jgi:hypothetical protein